jgi:hypothetical protein
MVDYSKYFKGENCECMYYHENECMLDSELNCNRTIEDTVCILKRE